jgi:hypothetical protein
LLKACCNTIDPVYQHPEALTHRNYSFLPIHPPGDWERSDGSITRFELPGSFHFGFEIKDLDLLQRLYSEILFGTKSEDLL